MGYGGWRDLHTDRLEFRVERRVMPLEDEMSKKTGECPYCGAPNKRKCFCKRRAK